MGFVDPHGNDGPIEHYYRTGDPSRGYPPSDHLTRMGDLDASTGHLNYGGTPTRTSSIIALLLSVAFLVVAFLSW